MFRTGCPTTGANTTTSCLMSVLVLDRRRSTRLKGTAPSTSAVLRSIWRVFYKSSERLRRGISGADALTLPRDAKPMPFVFDLDEQEILESFPRMPLTSLRSGVEKSVTRFQKMAASGQLTKRDIAESSAGTN